MSAETKGWKVKNLIETKHPKSTAKHFHMMENTFSLFSYVGIVWLLRLGPPTQPSEEVTCQRVKYTNYVAAAAKSLQSRPHRWQPTRLPCPWDSPGKNTGVGCHFLLQCMKVKSESEVPQSCQTPSDPMDGSPPGSSFHGIFHSRKSVATENYVSLS